MSRFLRRIRTSPDVMMILHVLLNLPRCMDGTACTTRSFCQMSCFLQWSALSASRSLRLKTIHFEARPTCGIQTVRKCNNSAGNIGQVRDLHLRQFYGYVWLCMAMTFQNGWLPPHSLPRTFYGACLGNKSNSSACELRLACICCRGECANSMELRHAPSSMQFAKTSNKIRHNIIAH